MADWRIREQPGEEKKEQKTEARLVILSCHIQQLRILIWRWPTTLSKKRNSVAEKMSGRTSGVMRSQNVCCPLAGLWKEPQSCCQARGKTGGPA